MQSIVDVGNAAMSHTGTAKYRGQHDEERFRKPPKGNVTLRIFPAQTRLYEAGSYRVRRGHVVGQSSPKDCLAPSSTA